MQHYDRRLQHEFALAKIDEAIEHTPTVIDLYSVKVCLGHLNLLCHLLGILFSSSMNANNVNECIHYYAKFGHCLRDVAAVEDP